MIAKYNGHCKVTNQPIRAGVTNIEKINGRWQVAPAKANSAHQAPAEAVVVLAWSDPTRDRYGDEYLKHYVSFGDEEGEPVGKIWTVSSVKVAEATASMLFEANKNQIEDIVTDYLF